MPLDKLQHAAAGFAAAVFGCAIYGLMIALGIVPLAGLPAAPLLTALTAGLTKEGADWLDNRKTPGWHTVDVWDAVATAAPGFALCVMLQLLELA